MPGGTRRSVHLLAFLFVLTFLPLSFVIVRAQQAVPAGARRIYQHHLPAVFRRAAAPQSPGIVRINQLRTEAGVPRVEEDPVLDSNCLQHARYMAENNDLTHQQDPTLPYASPEGQRCAEKGNMWLGTMITETRIIPEISIRGWMASVAHRLWLLYPTTKAFGFGAYACTPTRLGSAAIDVLTRADFGADTAYRGWPVRYPAPGQSNVPASRFPITLNWRYFGPAPTVKSATLSTSGGSALAADRSTSLPAGHKGIQIIPKTRLPANSTITVQVTGEYAGAPFSYTWQFTTGSATSWQEMPARPDRQTGETVLLAGP